MKQTDKNIYRLKLKCEKCNKDIFVCFDIHIKEIPDYGPEESYKPDKVPRYLGRILTPILYEGMGLDSSLYSNGINQFVCTKHDSRSYFVLCRKCEKIENIKS